MHGKSLTENMKELNSGDKPKKSMEETSKTDKTEEVHAPLPVLEMIIYAAFLVWAYATIIYQFCQLSLKREAVLLKYGYIDDGWSILNRGQDAGSEWRSWREHFKRPLFLGSLIAYVIFNRAVEIFIPKLREICISTACVAFLFTTYDWRGIAFILCQTVATYLITRTRRKSIVWLFTLALITIYDVKYLKANILVPTVGEENVGDTIYLSALCLLKFLSFSLECCDRMNIPTCPDTGRKLDTFYDLFVYNFYFPQFLVGPIHIYPKWRADMNKPVDAWDSQKYRQCFWEGLHYLGVLIFLEFALHYAYLPALGSDPITMHKSTFAQAAGYTMGCFLYFHLKYQSFYGFPRLLCLLDGVDSPKPPLCVNAIYTFKDAWRYLDRGLHDLLIRYIYLPMGGSKAGILRQLVASVCCFSLVGFWHGGKRHLIIWSAANCLGVTLETIVPMVAKAATRGRIPSCVSDAMRRRSIAMFSGVMYLGFILSNMFFLTGSNIATMMIEKLLFPENPLHPILAACFFYCGTQLLLGIYHKWGRHHICNKNYSHFGLGNQKSKLH